MAETGMNWYVLRAVSGKEAKLKEYIEAEIKHNDLLSANVAQVLIPTEKTYSQRNGRRVEKEKSLCQDMFLCRQHSSVMLHILCALCPTV